VVLFVGDDWAQDHHDVEVMDASGRRLVKARLPEGMAGMARLHAMIGQALGGRTSVAKAINGRGAVGHSSLRCAAGRAARQPKSSTEHSELFSRE
jgi:transposase